ncbi:MAG: hypothetical protein ACRCTZ_02340 [Sarcina sp.]
MFWNKNENIETRYVDYTIEENVYNKIIEYKLKVKKDIMAIASISDEKIILSVDYVEPEDLRFLLLMIIDKFETLKYSGAEICILEYGVNTKFGDSLSEEVIINRDSILDSKSFRYKKDKSIGNTLI